MKQQKKLSKRIMTGKQFKTSDCVQSTRNRSEPSTSNVCTKYLLTASDEIKYDKPLLQSIRSRRFSCHEEKITNKTVSSVIKNYVIPLFKQNIQSKSRKSRREGFGLRGLSVDADNKTFLGEILLSDQLREEIENLRVKVSESDKKIIEASSGQFAAEEELAKVKDELLEEKCLNQFLKNYFSQIEAKYHFYMNSYEFLNDRVKNYKKISSDYAEKNQEMSRKLNEERLLNDIRLF